MTKHIHQICPALPGTMARFKQEDGSILHSPVACWALVEDDDLDPGDPKYIVPFVTWRDDITPIDDATECSNFDGIDHV